MKVWTHVEFLEVVNAQSAITSDPDCTAVTRVFSSLTRTAIRCRADYVPSRYYPVQIGETFRACYQVIGKLGFGATSTVWLARDLRWAVHILHPRCVSAKLSF